MTVLAVCSRLAHASPVLLYASIYINRRCQTTELSVGQLMLIGPEGQTPDATLSLELRDIRTVPNVALLYGLPAKWSPHAVQRPVLLLRFRFLSPLLL